MFTISTTLITLAALFFEFCPGGSAASPVITIRNSPVNIPFVQKLNLNGSTIAERDRARANRLASGFSGSWGSPAGSNVNVENSVVIYVAEIGVGTPPTCYNLIVDTGSSNTWVGAGTPYVTTSSSSDTGNTVSVTYGSGMFSGEEYIDTVTLSPDLVINEQSIGVATSSSGFTGYDGILGIGPVDLTQGTVSNTNTVPTVTDNLFEQGTIEQEIIGISFNPITSDDPDGVLTFGGVDPFLYTGDITFTPITTAYPSSNYWGIDQQITYGDNGFPLSVNSGIADTGTTLILLDTAAFTEYVLLTGAEMDETTGLLVISQSQYSNLKSLYFSIGGSTFELIPNAQIWPRSLNSQIGGDPNSIYLIVGDLGELSGPGLTFINGYTFLERFYSVYDTTNRQVGFATTENTLAMTN